MKGLKWSPIFSFTLDSNQVLVFQPDALDPVWPTFSGCSKEFFSDEVFEMHSALRQRKTFYFGPWITASPSLCLSRFVMATDHNSVVRGGDARLWGCNQPCSMRMWENVLRYALTLSLFYNPVVGIRPCSWLLMAWELNTSPPVKDIPHLREFPWVYRITSHRTGGRCWENSDPGPLRLFANSLFSPPLQPLPMLCNFNDYN